MEVREGAVNSPQDSLREGRPWQRTGPGQRPGGSAQLVCLGCGAALGVSGGEAGTVEGCGRGGSLDFIPGVAVLSPWEGGRWRGDLL